MTEAGDRRDVFCAENSLRFLFLISRKPASVVCVCVCVCADVEKRHQEDRPNRYMLRVAVIDTQHVSERFLILANYDGNNERANH